MPTKKAPKDSCLIKSGREIKAEYDSFKEIIQDEINAEKGKPPREFFTIQRNFHRIMFSRKDYVQVWTIRNRIDLFGTVTVIGSSKNSDIRLDSDVVSRLHAIIRYENGQFVFYNQSTTSRILIHGQEMPFQRIL